MRLGPLPALALADVGGDPFQLLQDQPLQERGVLEPSAAILGEEVAKDGPAGLLVGQGADEESAAVARRDAGLGHHPPDGVWTLVPAQSLEHLLCGARDYAEQGYPSHCQA
jgi:hypothetical protein